ncbi:MAG: metallophosphatase family protein [Paludibacteraceae bacterium]|nr:metallophosphatase family protein [Paludibacteraceae bacterium]
MTRIGLLSDTHSYWDEKYLKYFAECDEVWHAGDIGSDEIADKFEAFRTFRAVSGNIDGTTLKTRYPVFQIFEVEGIKVVMTHIGGYPGRYHTTIPQVLDNEKPNIFISGHSHILKVMNDKQRGILHINPGAAGRYGYQKVRTIVRFKIDGNNIDDLEVIEIGSSPG